MSKEEEEPDVEAILARAKALREAAAELELPDTPGVPPVALAAESDEDPRRHITLVPLKDDEEAPDAAVGRVDAMGRVTAVPVEQSAEPETLPPDPFAAAKAAIARSREARGAGPMPMPERLDPNDPFAAAKKALDRAESARGVDLPAPEPLKDRHPMADAEAALAAAKLARAAHKTEVRLADALAAAQLRKLKKAQQAEEDEEE